MHVFVTGGSGVVGRGVVAALVKGGHEVTALAHRPASKELLEKLGARTVTGTIEEAAAVAAHAAKADAVAHLAQMTPPGRVSKAVAEPIHKADLAVTRAMLDALKGSNKPFIYSSGAWVYGPTSSGVRDESAPLQPYPLVHYKVEGEKLAQDAVKSGVAAMVTRPGSVYAPWGLFEQYVLRPNKEKGKASVLGSGAQRTSYVHVDDIGEMYRLMLEKPKPGEIFNLCDTEPVAVLTMASEVARLMGAKPPGKVPGFIIKLAMGLLGAPLLGDNPITAQKFLTTYGYTLKYPTYREGAKAVVDAYGKAA